MDDDLTRDLDPGASLETARVPVARVRPETHLVALRERVTAPAGGGGLSPADPSLREIALSAIRWRWVLASAAVGLALSIVLRDGSGIAFIAGFAVTGLRWIDGRILFTFADGIVGRRWDLGWPRGVQEDDDFTWTWLGGRASPGTR